MLDLKRYRIILASQSPRRAEILRNMGFEVVIHVPMVDERYSVNLDIHKVPEYLAQLKAETSRAVLQDKSDLLISADSVVIIDDTIIGKPGTEEEATQILQRLSGRTHKVITGVCLMTIGQQKLFSEMAEVTFYPLSEQEIAYYVEQWKPLDKAGAYGIQEWIGLCRVKEIQGTYSNIMGLPAGRVYEEIKCMFI